MSSLRSRVGATSRRISLLTVLAAGLALLGVAAPASAHDRLVSSDPADGSTVAAVPTAITLTFSDEVLDTGAQVVITPHGTGGDFSQPGQVAGKVVSVPAPPQFPNDTYQVAWRVVSADGHPVEGTFTFTLAAPEPSPSPTEAASPTPSAAATGADTAQPIHQPSAVPISADTPAQSGDVPSGLWIVFAAAVLASVAATVAWTRRRGSRVYGPPGQS
ncbi:copper resistance CopC family protein [Xylanimonas sp. McL0601]|uniref:copper resistance CopC family protein n=1 Tax=Xylanimonas sp. McL0601 TaxID=3414739 RepID=UPI003CFA53B9